MRRVYNHRYKVLSGPMMGLVSDGEQIGFQDYPDQFVKEGWDSHTIVTNTSGKKEGVWLFEEGVRVQRNDYRNTTITEEGVSYGDDYMDLCVPFDRYNTEIKEGDTLMIASKNEVRRVTVVAIAKKPYQASYGIMNRKLTVRDEVENQTLTINDPRATVKIG
jgi:hypothetical protein